MANCVEWNSKVWFGEVAYKYLQDLHKEKGTDFTRRHQRLLLVQFQQTSLLIWAPPRRWALLRGWYNSPTRTLTCSEIFIELSIWFKRLQWWRRQGFCLHEGYSLVGKNVEVETEWQAVRRVVGGIHALGGFYFLTSVTFPNSSIL